MSVELYNAKPLSQVKQEKVNQKKPLQTMEAELSALKTANLEKEAMIHTLGQELAMVKLELIERKGGEAK